MTLRQRNDAAPACTDAPTGLNLTDAQARILLASVLPASLDAAPIDGRSSP